MAQLYVGGLPAGTTEAGLRQLCSQVVTVTSVEVITDLRTGEPRGYGIVRVPDGAVAAVISALQGVRLGDSQLQVSRMPVTLPGEMQFRDWLHRNADEVLHAIGVKIGQSVLDYGCGPGIFTLAAARITGETGKVYALDVRPRALERLKESAASIGLKNIAAILGRGQDTGTGLPDSCIDVVLVYDVLQEIGEKKALLAELRRVLKPGGLLSVFPMHTGNEAALELFREDGRFRFAHAYAPPGHRSPSTILNLV